VPANVTSQVGETAMHVGNCDSARVHSQGILGYFSNQLHLSGHPTKVFLFKPIIQSFLLKTNMHFYIVII